jgi:hypothetical protein
MLKYLNEDYKNHFKNMILYNMSTEVKDMQ